jgi:hypothetical protein
MALIGRLLQHRSSPPETPSIGSISTSSRMAAARQSVKSIQPTTGTPFHRCQPPAPSRVLGLPASATAHPPEGQLAPQATPLLPGRDPRRCLSPISATDLLSAGTPWIHRLPSSRAHALPTPASQRASRRVRTLVRPPERGLAAETLARLQAASPAPSRATDGGVATSCSLDLPYPRGGRPALLPDKARVGLFDHGASPVGLTADASCHTAPPSRLSPPHENDAKGPFHRRHTFCRRFPDPKRLPPLGPGRQRPLAQPLTCRAATGALA